MAAVISGGVRKIGIVAPNRIVRACNRTTGALVEETISDQVGNYTFETLDTGTTYYVYALDETFNQYNATIGDALKPMPLFSFTGSSIGSIIGVSSSSYTFNLSVATSIGSIPLTGNSTVTINTVNISTIGAKSSGTSSYTIDVTTEASGLLEHPVYEVTGTAEGFVDVSGYYSVPSTFTYTMGIGNIYIDMLSSSEISTGDVVNGSVYVDMLSNSEISIDGVADGSTA